MKLRTGSPVPWCLGLFKRHFGARNLVVPPGVGPERPKDAYKEVIEEAPLGQFKWLNGATNQSGMDHDPAAYSAEKARQGEIILRKPWQRMVFAAGLIIPFVVLFIGWLLMWHWA